MAKQFRNILQVCSAISLVTLLVSNAAFAQIKDPVNTADSQKIIGGETMPAAAVPNSNSSQSASFARQINTCFSLPENTPEPEAKIRMEIGVDESGALVTTRIIGSKTRSPAERDLLRSAYLALLDCTPVGQIDLGKGQNAFRILITARGIDAADEAPTPKSEDVSVTSATDSAEIANAATETALAFNRGQRREIQRRLTLIGHDTNGVDGVFGKGTRAALSAWQSASGLPSSGFLDQAQLDMLNAQSAPEFAKWQARPKRYYGPDGCLREPNGRIIRGRTVLCDLNAAFQ